jgi:sugar (pentulose or hexulose) kinase
MTANAIGRPVIAGPTEATALGNAVVQFIAHGDLKDIAEARTMLANSIDTVTYEPQDSAVWAAQADRLSALIN